MRYNSDDALMAKCKSLDFSVESANYDKNLEILKGKLADINEERCAMNKARRMKKPFAILVAVIAIMAMSAATLAAASPALRDRARAVRHEDGSITVSVTADAGTASFRVTEEGGVLTMETTCGNREIIHIYDAADLCPDDVLFGEYNIHSRPDNIPGLEAFRSYSAEVDEVTINHFISIGYGVIQVEDHTYFYRMTDDCGNIVNGAAVVEADGSMYFVADCGERTLIFKPCDWL